MIKCFNWGLIQIAPTLIVLFILSLKLQHLLPVLFKIYVTSKLTFLCCLIYDCMLYGLLYCVFTHCDFLSCRFCVGDKFYLCDNKILCEYDYEERMVFANMTCSYNALSQIKKQTQSLSDDLSSGYGSPSPNSL